MDAWKRKLKIARYILSLEFFFCGVELSIILPSLPFYLQEVDTPNVPVFFGALHATYLCFGVIVSLVISRLAETTLHLRRTMLAINTISVLGNAVYTMGGSPYALLVGRFLGGAVVAVFTVTFLEYRRCYSNNEICHQVHYLIFAYGVGLCIGPTFNLIPKSKEMNFGFILLRYTNAPGILLTFGYLTLFTICLFGLSDVSFEKQASFSCSEKDSFVEQDAFIRKDNFHGQLIYGSAPKSANNSFDGERETTSHSESAYGTAYPEQLGEEQLISNPDIPILFYGQMVWVCSFVSNDCLMALVATQIDQMSLQLVSYLYIVSGVATCAGLWSATRMQIHFNSASLSITGFILFSIAYALLALTTIVQSLPVWGTWIVLFVYAGFSAVAFSLNVIALKTIIWNRVSATKRSNYQGVFSAGECVTAIVSALSIGFSYQYLPYFSFFMIVLNQLAIVLFARFHTRLSKPIEVMRELSF